MKTKSSSQQNQGCLASLLSLIGIKLKPPKSSQISVEYLPADPEPEQFPYRLRDDFLSPAEKSFYQVIKGMMGNYFTICPKVSLGDLFFVPRPHENSGAYNRINRKHVDFVICDSRTLTPQFAIELDDSSHERADRVERDAFVERVFEAAQLPLLRIPVQLSYNTNELGNIFKNALQQRNKSVTSPEPGTQPAPAAAILPTEPSGNPAGTITNEKQAPLCPKCGTPMVLRTAKSGTQSGRKFYGCANYPKCRAVLPLEGMK